jgi:hypothetical protein
MYLKTISVLDFAVDCFCSVFAATQWLEKLFGSRRSGASTEQGQDQLPAGSSIMSGLLYSLTNC